MLMTATRASWLDLTFLSRASTSATVQRGRKRPDPGRNTHHDHACRSRHARGHDGRWRLHVEGSVLLVELEVFQGKDSGSLNWIKTADLFTS